MVTDRSGEPSLPTYSRLSAPPGLRTRRQLRAQGRSPGRQEIAALLKFRRRGREIVAYLFDIARSVPKRAATPAQLAALREGNRERQIQAAARRGYSRESLSTEGDPGPGWDSAAAHYGQVRGQRIGVGVPVSGAAATAASLIAAATTRNRSPALSSESAPARALPPDPTVTATPAVEAEV